MKFSQIDGNKKLKRSKIKIAFLMMVHNNPEQLNCFINQVLQYSESYVYIHVDKKGTHIIPSILKHNRVHILEEHIDGKWGDYTQIQMVNYLIRYAINDNKFDYYSLHSGSDLLIKPINELVEFLGKEEKYGYYNCSELPSKWQYGGGLGRIALKWPKMFRVACKKNSIVRYARSIYGKMYGAGVIKGRHLPEKYSYYGGDAWFTISHDCAQDYIDFIDSNEDFNELFYNALCSDEIYYVSIFQMCKKDRAVWNHNALRYIDWENRGQKLGVGSPNTCDMSFLQEIEQSDAFFARKFDRNHDSDIIDYFMKKTRAQQSEI